MWASEDRRRQVRKERAVLWLESIQWLGKAVMAVIDRGMWFARLGSAFSKRQLRIVISTRPATKEQAAASVRCNRPQVSPPRS